MKIRDLLSGGKRSISFEFFPPKTDQGLESLFKTIQRLKTYQPSYVSVTYGAGGSTRDKTVEVVTRIKKETGLEPMSHVTCTAQTREEVHNVLVRLSEERIDNVLALRGDPPRGEEKFVPVEGGFRNSVEIMAYMRENFEFGIAGSCFPEVHPEAVDSAADMDYLKKKVDAGAEFFITQLFFDNADFFEFMERVEQARIRVPVLTGVLPILSTSQIRRFTASVSGEDPSHIG